MIKLKTYKLLSHKDHRGELLSNTDHKLGEQIKHFFIATINPGETRGNHYHHHKKEWFIILGGKAKIKLTDIKSRATKEIVADSKACLAYEMDINVIHSITNISKRPITLLALVNDFFDKKNPDTFYKEDGSE